MKQTSFNEKCYDLLKRVPRGKVTTYKALAQALGTRAYRAVGSAMNKNPFLSHIVPCHRVIKSNGEVGGYARGTKEKIKMLKKEGISVHNGKVDLEEYSHTFKKQNLLFRE